MKELEAHLKTKAELHAEKNQQQHYKLIGNVHLKSGCKLWCYNKEKGTMESVKLNKKAAVSITDQSQKAMEASYDPKCLYFQAINERNAWRKLAQFNTGRYEVAEDFEPKYFESLSNHF